MGTRRKVRRWIRVRAQLHTERASIPAMDPKDLDRVIWESRRRCAYCRRHCGRKFHIDHRIPLSRGGTHRFENLCLACPRCNLQKRTMTDLEFRQSSHFWIIQAGRSGRKTDGETLRGFAMQEALDRECWARLEREP